MNQTPAWLEKWNKKLDSFRPKLNAAANAASAAGDFVQGVFNFIYRLRSLFLAIPVVVAALKLARVNYELLPPMVGLYLLNDGSFAFVVTRNVAVYGPLAVTAVCLLMMAFSRKTVYPWVISIFTLTLPLLILVINVFPG